MYKEKEKEILDFIYQERKKYKSEIWTAIKFPHCRIKKIKNIFNL